MQKDLNEIEEKIEAMFHGNEEGVFNEDKNLQMKDLEKKKEKLLAIEEKELRLKSRAIWLEAGDKNSNFFHNYETHRRNINTICEIKNQEGRLVRNFEEKADAGVSFFQNIFKEPEGCPIY